MTTENILQKKAMLVQFSAAVYSGRKKDKNAAASVSKEFGNEIQLGNYIKQSIPAEHLKGIQSAVNEFRIFLYTHTLPWSHKGELLLSTDLYEKIMEKEREIKIQFESLVSVFLENYESYQNEARSRLNGLYNPADYPCISKIQKKFSWDINFSPVPAGNDLKVDLAEEDIKKISADIESKNDIALKKAMDSIWQRIFDSVKHLSEKMKESRTDKNGNDVSPIFKDTIIENIQELVSLLPSLNITNDPALEQARRDLESDLAGVDPEILRESKETRKEIADKADQILNNIGQLF